MGVLGGLESGHNPMTLSDSALTLKSGYRDFVISKMIRLLTLGVRFGVDPDSVMAVLEDPQRVGCTGMTPFLLSPIQADVVANQQLKWHVCCICYDRILRYGT